MKLQTGQLRIIKRYRSSIQFDVLEISAQEIPERLIIGRDVNELPDIILVRDQEIKNI